MRLKGHPTHECIGTMAYVRSPSHLHHVTMVSQQSCLSMLGISQPLSPLGDDALGLHDGCAAGLEKMPPYEPMSATATRTQAKSTPARTSSGGSWAFSRMIGLRDRVKT